MEEKLKDDLLSKKDDCEKKILDAVTEFEKSTGLDVKDIHYVNGKFGRWVSKKIAIEVTI